MAKSNWAQECSNTEKLIMQKGNWSITEDGEKTWSLYYKDNCVDPVLDYNKYWILEHGVLLSGEYSEFNKYCLLHETEKTPVFKAHGKDLSYSIKEGVIIFDNKNETKTFNAYSLTPLKITEENQLGFDL